MLVDHAEAEAQGLARARDLDLAVVDQHRARVGPVIAHDAFDERALARAVAPEEGMEIPRRETEPGTIEDRLRAEALGDPVGLQAWRDARPPVGNGDSLE